MNKAFGDLYIIVTFVQREIEMSPKIIVEGGYIIYWFSNEEARMHVHVKNGDKKAKFWMDPEIELQSSWGFNMKELGVNSSLNI